jgi:hypothetical protein
VRKDVFKALRLLFLPTLGVAAIAAFLPGRIDQALRVYALLACTAVLAVALAALRRAYPPARPLGRTEPRRTRRRRPPSSLGRLEDEAALGVAGTFDFHHHFRPHLRAISHEVLLSRRQVSLDGDPDAARTILGDETWELVRADRPPPEDRLARGIPVADLRGAVESLEAV